MVLNGQYDVPEVKGLLPGKYEVRIYWPTPVVAKPGAPGPLGLAPPVERVPNKYNNQTELVTDVELGGKSQFDFDLHTDESE